MIEKWLSYCDPETAHAIAKKIIQIRYSGFLPYKTRSKPTTVFGLHFTNPIGLAAGWDKDADCVDALFRMGFGFVEVGTVTPQPQYGNPKPRLFRIPEKQAFINRMGFNNLGVEALVEKIKNRKMQGILGVNLGKNKETLLDNALSDYEIGVKSVYPYADYIVINISSPNTPQLRELQSSHYLNQLLQGVQRVRKQMAGQYHRDVPMLIKTTVDFPEAAWHAFVMSLLEYQIDGCVISNTTLDHSSVSQCAHGDESGGLSGRPLFEKSVNMVKKVVEIAENKLPVIAVGGIFSAADALSYQKAGASLFQLYSGWIYRGPRLIDEILMALP